MEESGAKWRMERFYIAAHNTISNTICQITNIKHIQTYQIRVSGIFSYKIHIKICPIMSYNLVQIFDKNGEKYIILFDNL